MLSNNSSGVREKQAADGQKQKPKHDVGCGPGKLTIVSLGPGNSQYLAPKAKTALEQAEVVVGYKTYMDLIDPGLIRGKETISTGMTGEIRRCRMAIDQAHGGKNTVIVSSGDSGIYGMAGLVIELLADQGFLDTVEVEVIPGIPALSAAAALLGAPIMHDFAVISLSDLMTPWDQIRNRVEAAARTDFVLVIYNPKSKKRNWQLGSVRDAILKVRSGDTPVGIVRNAAREGESVRITTLSKIDESTVDMLSILLVGNSKTCIMGDKMVTPRGYLEKYGEAEGLLNMDKGNE